MDKKANRLVPFKGKYKMRLDVFCNKYGRDVRRVLHRMHARPWGDKEANIVPTALEDTGHERVKQALSLIEYGWSDNEIAKRIGVEPRIVPHIRNMSDYEKTVFMDCMKGYFFFDIEKIDFDKLFVENQNAEVKSAAVL